MRKVLILGVIGSALALAAERTTANADVIEFFFSSSHGSSEGYIYRVVAGSNDPQLILTTPHDGRPMMVESYGDMLYWSTYYPGGLWRGNLDIEVPELLVDQGNTTTRAIRFLDDKVYWANESQGKLYRSDLDGSNIEVMISGYVGYGAGLWDFDIYEDRFYWTSWDSNKVRSTALDGTDYQIYEIAGASRIFNVEAEDDHLFLTDDLDGSSSILRMDLDGTNIVVLADDLPDNVLSLSTFGDRLYYGWRGHDDEGIVGHIASMNFNGNDIRVEMIAPGVDIWQFHAVALEDNGDDLIVTLDIKPGSCPNSFNRNSNGVLPMALLGTKRFDVTLIDISTLLLSRTDGVGGTVAPLNGPPGPGIRQADVATPFSGELCDCHELESDGIVDLVMKFDSAELVEVLELNRLPGGSDTALNVSGSLLDKTVFVATDCIHLVPPVQGVSRIEADNGEYSDEASVSEAVQLRDLTSLIKAWGTSSGPEDINDDGVVDILDLFEILSMWR